MAYNFATSYHQGIDDEARLDAHFRRSYIVYPVSDVQQRHGIDRYFIYDNWYVAVEYKADRTADSTGNAFIETISVLRQGKVEHYGWVYTSQADVLIYYLPQQARAYWLPFHIIRACLPDWEQECETRAVENDDYYTVGLLVPLERLDELCAHPGEVDGELPREQR